MYVYALYVSVSREFLLHDFFYVQRFPSWHVHILMLFKICNFGQIIKLETRISAFVLLSFFLMEIKKSR